MIDDGRRCTAKSKRSGERCKRAATPGVTVCWWHGSAAPQVRAAAQRRTEVTRVEAEARAVQAIPDRTGMTVAEVYAELLATAEMVVEWRDRMAVLVENLASYRYSASGAGTEQLRAEVALYERALDRTVKTAELIARLNLDARAQALSSRQGDLVATAIRRILAALELTPAQEARVPVVVPKELRRIAEGQ